MDLFFQLFMSKSHYLRVLSIFSFCFFTERTASTGLFTISFIFSLPYKASKLNQKLKSKANMPKEFKNFTHKAWLKKMSQLSHWINRSDISVAGIFTAPVKGYYYIRFNGWEARPSQTIRITLYHNDKIITTCFDNKDVYNLTVSNAFVLQLEKGDVVYMVLNSGYGIYDSLHNRTTFSGFLLFAVWN